MYIHVACRLQSMSNLSCTQLFSCIHQGNYKSHLSKVSRLVKLFEPLFDGQINEFSKSNRPYYGFFHYEKWKGRKHFFAPESLSHVNNLALIAWLFSQQENGFSIPRAVYNVEQFADSQKRKIDEWPRFVSTKLPLAAEEQSEQTMSRSTCHSTPLRCQQVGKTPV